MWWENPSEATILQFFDECHDYTQKMIKKAVGNISRTWPFNHHLDSKRHPFTPKGAVINITNTLSVWDALRLYARQWFGVHFMITGHPAPSGYELISQLPAAVLTPMRFDRALPHASYLSTRTWGFDLRLLGRLRPYFSATGQRPPPVYPEVAGGKMFNDVGVSNPDLYYQKNLWTSKFEGGSTFFAGYWWEMPVRSQMLTLVYILRALNRGVEDLDPALILPSHCLNRKAHTMPFTDWDTFRRAIMVDQSHLAGNFCAAYPNHTHPLEWNTTKSSCDEDEIATLMKWHEWRAETDDGGLNYLDSDARPNDSLMSFGRQSELLTGLGFHGVDYRKSIRLFSIHDHIPAQRINDAPPKLIKAMERFYK